MHIVKEEGAPLRASTSRGAPPGDPDSYLPLVRAAAGAIARTGAHLRVGLEFGDLVGEGAVGLMQAARRFDPTRGFKFSTFAYWRIRGAMRDALGAATAWQSSLTFATTDASDRGAQHEALEVHLDRGWRIADAVRDLPPVEQQLIGGFFFEGRTLDEVGREVGWSRSHTCRRLARVIAHLRARLVPVQEVMS